MTEQQAEDPRVKLTRYIMNLLDEWELNAEQQVGVLALPEGTRTRVLRSFREDTPFPETNDVNTRIEHILAIDDALHTTYPHSNKMGQLWMRRAHRRFRQRTPVNTIIEDGLQGLVSVRMHLDCSYISG